MLGDTTFAALMAALVAIGVAVFSVRATIHERKRKCLRELQLNFFYGEMLEARLKAERMLYVDETTYKDKNLKQLFEGDMPADDYVKVAKVLNLFRIVNEFKACGYIDETEARAAFSWVYRWWWEKVISQRIAGIENDPEWRPISGDTTGCSRNPSREASALDNA